MVKQEKIPKTSLNIDLSEELEIKKQVRIKVRCGQASPDVMALLVKGCES